MEKTFDQIEKSKRRETNLLSTLLPSQNNLTEWLASFETIQRELNACVSCLDEGWLLASKKYLYICSLLLQVEFTFFRHVFH